MHTLAGRLHQHGVAVNSGEITDEGFLFVWWGCPPDRHDLSTTNGLLPAVRDANPAADLFLYHLGIWTTGAQAWLPDGAWDACARPDITVPDGADVCLGFDGSW